MAAHRSPDGETTLFAIAADAVLLDDLAARRPVRCGDAVAQVLAAWAAEVDREPLPPFPPLTDAAGSDGSARPGGATHQETPVPVVDMPTQPIPRPRVRVTATRPDPPRIHPEYERLRDAPLDVAEPPSMWLLLGVAVVAGVIVGCLLGGILL